MTRFGIPARWWLFDKSWTESDRYLLQKLTEACFPAILSSILVNWTKDLLGTMFGIACSLDLVFRAGLK